MTVDFVKFILFLLLSHCCDTAQTACAENNVRYVGRDYLKCQETLADLFMARGPFRTYTHTHLPSFLFSYPLRRTILMIFASDQTIQLPVQVRRAKDLIVVYYTRDQRICFICWVVSCSNVAPTRRSADLRTSERLNFKPLHTLQHTKSVLIYRVVRNNENNVRNVAEMINLDRTKNKTFR